MPKQRRTPRLRASQKKCPASTLYRGCFRSAADNLTGRYELTADVRRCQQPLSARNSRLEKESARLENPNGDAFAVPSLASPGDITLRQLFGGVKPGQAHQRFLSLSFNGDIRIYERETCDPLSVTPDAFKKCLGLSTLPPAGHLLNVGRGTGNVGPPLARARVKESPPTLR